MILVFSSLEIRFVCLDFIQVERNYRWLNRSTDGCLNVNLIRNKTICGPWILRATVFIVDAHSFFPILCHFQCCIFGKDQLSLSYALTFFFFSLLPFYTFLDNSLYCHIEFTIPQSTFDRLLKSLDTRVEKKRND